MVRCRGQDLSRQARGACCLIQHKVAQLGERRRGVWRSPDLDVLHPAPGDGWLIVIPDVGLGQSVAGAQIKFQDLGRDLRWVPHGAAQTAVAGAAVPHGAGVADVVMRLGKHRTSAAQPRSVDEVVVIAVHRKPVGRGFHRRGRDRRCTGRPCPKAGHHKDRCSDVGNRSSSHRPGQGSSHHKALKAGAGGRVEGGGGVHVGRMDERER